jgi:type IV pilus assembly protein PilF
MRRSGILLCACLGMLLVGCHRSSTKIQTINAPQPPMPTTTKAEQARNAAQVHTELAQHYMQNGDLQTALEKLKLALKFDDSYEPAHTVIAVVYERINDLPDAEANYRKAAELEPKKGSTNNNLGAFLCRTGKTSEAIPYFQKAVADPFYSTPDMALTNEGVCQVRANDLVGGEASLRKAIELNPQNAEALYQLANAFYLGNDAFHASAFLQRYEALGQTSPAALKLGYDIELRQGDRDAALNYRRRLQSQFPDSEQARAIDTTASQ